MQPHVFDFTSKPSAKPVPSSEKLNETWAKRRHCPTCHCNGKRVYKTAAERQKAYRERHKAANGS